MVKGLSEKVAEMFVSQDFKDFGDVCDFVITQPKINKRHVQILLKLGYFDPMPGSVDEKYKLYQLKLWQKQNEDKKSEWQEKKDAGRKVREFTDVKFEEERIDGNPKEWVTELLGFSFETRLMKLLPKIPQAYLSDKNYIVGEVTLVKSGMKNGRTWCLVKISTLDGEVSGFLKNPGERVYKGEVIYCKYTQRDTTYSFFHIEKVN
jgi:hypothetical protein